MEKKWASNDKLNKTRGKQNQKSQSEIAQNRTDLVPGISKPKSEVSDDARTE